MSGRSIAICAWPTAPASSSAVFPAGARANSSVRSSASWAVSPAVQLATIDGKGSADYAVWEQRAWLQAGDDLAAALAVLEDVHSVMRKRLGSVLEETGHKNAWAVGPTLGWPLLVLVMDECQTFLDSAAVKGRKPAEDQVRRCQSLVAELVRKGSVSDGRGRSGHSEGHGRQLAFVHSG